MAPRAGPEPATRAFRNESGHGFDGQGLAPTSLNALAIFEYYLRRLPRRMLRPASSKLYDLKGTVFASRFACGGRRLVRPIEDDNHKDAANTPFRRVGIRFRRLLLETWSPRTWGKPRVSRLFVLRDHGGHAIKLYCRCRGSYIDPCGSVILLLRSSYIIFAPKAACSAI